MPVKYLSLLSFIVCALFLSSCIIDKKQEQESANLTDSIPKTEAEKRSIAISKIAGHLFVNNYGNRDSMLFALELIDSAIKISPDDINLYDNKRAYLKEFEGMYDEKISVLDTIIKHWDFTHYKVQKAAYIAKRDSVNVSSLLEDIYENCDKLCGKYPDSSELLFNKLYVMIFTHDKTATLEGTKKLLALDTANRNLVLALDDIRKQYTDNGNAIETLMEEH